MSAFALIFLAALAPAAPASGAPFDFRNTDGLIAMLQDPDPRAEDMAWMALWAMPRAWTPEQLDAVLHWVSTVPAPMQPRIAGRVPTLLGMLVVPRQDRGQPGLLPEEIPLVQSLYSSLSATMLESLLTNDWLLRSVPIADQRFEYWLQRPDEVSLAALRIAPSRMNAKAMVALLEADWNQASPEWRMQSVQLGSSAPEYLAWLQHHLGEGDEIGRRAQATLQLHSSSPQERKATIEIIGKSNDAGIMTSLVQAMRDPDPLVAASALATFWETPRPYTAEVMEDMLRLIPDASLTQQRTIVENLPLMVGVIGQQRGMLRQSPLSPQDTQIVQSLFDTDDPRLLRNLLAEYMYFSGVTLSGEQLRRWIAMPDDISIKALPLAPRALEAAALIAALDERWKAASPVWKLQAVQIPWGDPHYQAWLENHLEPGEVGEIARLTLLTFSGFTPAQLAEVRSQLATPAALHRWAQLLPSLGRAGGNLALAELQPDGLLTPDFIPYWSIFGTPVPPATAAALLSDRRMSVRAFAAQFVQLALPVQAKEWCASEYPDVRVVGARLADRAAVEDLLVDDRSEVRLAAIVRWAAENWPGLEQTLKYGLSDPVLTDNLLMATVGLPQCQAILSAWGANEPQRSKLNSAKSNPHPPLTLPQLLPAR